MSSINSDLGLHTIGAAPNQRGVTVEGLVAQVANLYKGAIFKRDTEWNSFDLRGVVPLRLRENFDQGTFGVHEIFERLVRGNRDRVQLLIKGPPGIGKSTLTRQLAALWQKVQFSNEPLTQDEERLREGFDRYRLVVRIPLDQLRGEYPIYWEEYLFEQLEFDDKESFSDTLNFLLREKRILFVLDDCNMEIDTIDFQATGIQDVLRTQNWIMTSRFNRYRGEGRAEFEQFEIVDLSLVTVLDYIRRYFSKPEQAESLIEFISRFPALEEIVRVPRLLEILCFNWRENEARVFANATTTSLLEFLVLNILKKYLTRLGKDVRFATSLDQLFSEQEIIQHLRTAELEFGGNPNLLEVFNSYRLAAEIG